MYIDKLLDKIRKDKKELAKSYNVATSAIVYIGNNKYIVVKDGQEIRIQGGEKRTNEQNTNRTHRKIFIRIRHTKDKVLSEAQYKHYIFI